MSQSIISNITKASGYSKNSGSHYDHKVSSGYSKKRTQQNEEINEKILEEYEENEQKRRQLMQDNLKRRKAKERQLKEQQKREQERIQNELNKKKIDKQSAYLKYLRGNTDGISKNLYSQQQQQQNNKKYQTINNQEKKAVQIKSTYQQKLKEKALQQKQIEKKPKKIEQKQNQQKQTFDNQTKKCWKSKQKLQNLNALDLEVQQSTNNFEKLIEKYKQMNQITNIEMLEQFQKEGDIFVGKSQLLESLDLDENVHFKKKPVVVQNQEKNNPQDLDAFKKKLNSNGNKDQSLEQIIGYESEDNSFEVEEHELNSQVQKQNENMFKKEKIVNQKDLKENTVQAQQKKVEKKIETKIEEQIDIQEQFSEQDSLEDDTIDQQQQPVKTQQNVIIQTHIVHNKQTKKQQNKSKQNDSNLQGSKFKDKFIRNIEDNRKKQRTTSPCSLYARNQDFDEEEYLKVLLLKKILVIRQIQFILIKKKLNYKKSQLRLKNKRIFKELLS